MKKEFQEQLTILKKSNEIDIETLSRVYGISKALIKKLKPDFIKDINALNPQPEDINLPAVRHTRNGLDRILSGIIKEFEIESDERLKLIKDPFLPMKILANEKKYYHIKLLYNSRNGEIKSNLSEKELIEKFIEPYERGITITVNGASINPKELSRVLVYESNEPIEEYIEKVRVQDKLNPSPWKGLFATIEWRAMDKTNNISDKYITCASGSMKSEITEEKQEYDSQYINFQRIEELKTIRSTEFDLSKLIRLCEEVNSSWKNKNIFSVVADLRTILNHIPPVFGYKNFEEVANHYSGGSSFKKVATKLFDSLKNIADYHLHSQIRKAESLPNETQVDFENELDFILAELCKILKNKNAS